MTDLLSPVSRINLAGWYHLIGFGLIIPILAWRTRKQIHNTARPLPSRLLHMRSTAGTLLLFGAVSAFVARRQYIHLFTVRPISLAALGSAFVMYALAVALMRPRWRKAVQKRARIVQLYMPQTFQERLWWITVAVLAGVSEEITWRGVQTPLAAAALGGFSGGALFSAASFGVGHIVQGWRSVVVTALFALAFQGLVWLSGSLYTAMIVHIAYDITAGLTYGKLARELGYDIPPTTSSLPAREGKAGSLGGAS